MFNVSFLKNFFYRNLVQRKTGFFSLCRKTTFLGRVRVHSFVMTNNVILGDMSYVANFSRLTNCRVGKFTSIGPNVKIGVGVHPRGWVSTHPAFFSVKMQTHKTYVNCAKISESEEVVIGNDVWIGQSVIVLDGITIGNGAIIGAGAVVTRNIPAYAIAVGVPARVVKSRFNESDIEFLEGLRWWDMDDDLIQKYACSFENIEILKRDLTPK